MDRRTFLKAVSISFAGICAGLGVITKAFCVPDNKVKYKKFGTTSCHFDGAVK